MLSIRDGIIIGAAGGAMSGIMIWAFKYGHTKLIEYHEKERVYKWLKENTSNEPGKQFRSTRAIASWNNLTEDRVRYICSIHDKIFLSTGEREDMWGIYEHTPRSVYENRGLISF
jgi:hypothetical protein